MIENDFYRTKEMSALENTRTLKSIAVALWIIAVVMMIELGMYFFQLITAPCPDEYLAMSQKVAERTERKVNRSFREMDLQTLVREAAVIIQSEYQDEGDKWGCRVKNVLKGKANSSFSRGDELSFCTRYKRKNTSYGDGSIHFFRRNDTYPSYSTSIFHGHLPGFQDIPLDKFKAEVLTAGDGS